MFDIKFKDNKKKLMLAIYLAWFSATLFYCFQFILRVAPNIMTEEISSSFKMTSNDFASLGSLYLFGYSLLQIPLGRITDAIGVKSMMLYSIILCIIGSCMFGSAHELVMLLISRVIIGIGSASALLCALKIIADHFPVGKRALFMGLTLTFGTVGALLSGNALIYLLHHFTWRIASYISGALGIIVLILTIFYIPQIEKRQTAEGKHGFSVKNLWNVICSILKRKDIIVYSLLATGIYTPLPILADLWGAILLKTKFGIEEDVAAQSSLILYLGLGLGSICIPWFCEKFEILKQGIIVSLFVIIVNLIILVLLKDTTQFQLYCIMGIIGFFCGAEMMCFAIALQFASTKNSGEVIGIVNTFNMLGGAILQQVIGYLVNTKWTGEYTAAGGRAYSADAYEFVLYSLIFVVLCSLILSFFTKKDKL